MWDIVINLCVTLIGTLVGVFGAFRLNRYNDSLNAQSLYYGHLKLTLADLRHRLDTLTELLETPLPSQATPLSSVSAGSLAVSTLASNPALIEFSGCGLGQVLREFADQYVSFTEQAEGPTVADVEGRRRSLKTLIRSGKYLYELLESEAQQLRPKAGNRYKHVKKDQDKVASYREASGEIQ